ncbi:ABC transporter ATP-binding protein [Niallia sp. MER TA 168]|uniref:ABC transporter ATP-binding protein n=1 Tax=Niallia sp. MER TA 168 TaxID=2939568 RepID=UPI00203BBC90|nr:ABC transporter ATP-binding protein [Niallia sp. MER TA 168]MCM3364091.1 ABC transporter ATP-binding protein [Niallia sp. MER TA 168]
MEEYIIYTNQLSKSYQNFQAVNQVSLRVKKGEIYGFLGLNGAGKTTTIRMLLGMIQPSSGSCFINGEKVSAGNHQLWKQVGYMVETPFAYPELTVRENLEVFRKLHQINSAAVTSVIERLNLTSFANKKAKHLSLGNAQRLGIAKALLHDPKVLLLDEPTNGLDPSGIVEIRELLLELANKGTTVFISSHILGEIAKIATKIGIIHHGRLIQELTKEQLEQNRITKLIVKTRNRKNTISFLNSLGYKVRENEKEVIEITDTEAIKKPDELVSKLVHANYSPTMVLVEEEDLETYFLRVIGENGGNVNEAIH